MGVAACCLFALQLAFFAGGSSAAMAAAPAPQKLRWSSMFRDTMVLQQAPKRAKVWGFAAPGAAVSVALDGEALGARSAWLVRPIDVASMRRAPVVEPVCERVVDLLRSAALPWSPERHGLFPASFRAALLALLCVAQRLGEGSEGALPTALPRELWFEVVSYLPRGWFFRARRTKAADDVAKYK